jgi:hypothetical protein
VSSTTPIENSEKPAVLLPVERLASGPIMDAKVTTILLVLLMAHLAFTETCKCTQLHILDVPLHYSRAPVIQILSDEVFM